MARARDLDVSELPAPEPMQRVLSELGRLGPGEFLRVRHRREPFPLYAMLGDLGCVHRARRLLSSGRAAEAFEILVWRADDVDAAAACGVPDDPPATPGEGCD